MDIRRTIHGLKADGSPAYTEEEAVQFTIQWDVKLESATKHHKFSSAELRKVLVYGDLPTGTHILIDNEDAR